jgi:hypothetical protein
MGETKMLLSRLLKSGPGTDHSMSKPQNHPMQFSIEMKNEGNGHLSVREMRKIPGGLLKVIRPH